VVSTRDFDQVIPVTQVRILVRPRLFVCLFEFILGVRLYSETDSTHILNNIHASQNSFPLSVFSDIVYDPVLMTESVDPI